MPCIIYTKQGQRPQVEIQYIPFLSCPPVRYASDACIPLYLHLRHTQFSCQCTQLCSRGLPGFPAGLLNGVFNGCRYVVWASSVRMLLCICVLLIAGRKLEISPPTFVIHTHAQVCSKSLRIAVSTDTSLRQLSKVGKPVDNLHSNANNSLYKEGNKARQGMRPHSSRSKCPVRTSQLRTRTKPYQLIFLVTDLWPETLSVDKHHTDYVDMHTCIIQHLNVYVQLSLMGSVEYTCTFTTSKHILLGKLYTFWKSFQ